MSACDSRKPLGTPVDQGVSHVVLSRYVRLDAHTTAFGGKGKVRFRMARARLSGTTQRFAEVLSRRCTVASPISSTEAAASPLALANAAAAAAVCRRASVVVYRLRNRSLACASPLQLRGHLVEVLQKLTRQAREVVAFVQRDIFDGIKVCADVRGQPDLGRPV